jgi:hypothetical protein
VTGIYKRSSYIHIMWSTNITCTTLKNVCTVYRCTSPKLPDTFIYKSRGNFCSVLSNFQFMLVSKMNRNWFIKYWLLLYCSIKAELYNFSNHTLHCVRILTTAECKFQYCDNVLWPNSNINIILFPPHILTDSKSNPTVTDAKREWQEKQFRWVQRLKLSWLIRTAVKN